MVPLPSELPSQSRNYQTTHDPQLSDAKEMRRRYEADPRASTSDPRLSTRVRAPKPKSSRYRPRRHLECTEYEFDRFSVGPPPPCEIVVAGLAPRTTPAQVLQPCRAFGPVSASELKVDPQTGESIGIMWVCFASTGAGRSHATAAAAARQAQRTLNQQKIGLETVRVVLDRDRAAYVQQYRALLGERYARKREERARAEAQRRAREQEERASASPARAGSWRAPRVPRRPPAAQHGAPHPHAAALPAAVAQRLADLGHPYVFVPRVQSNALDDTLLRDLIAPFSPVLFERDAHGSYVGFAARETAARCRMVLETRAVQGGRLRLEVRDAPPRSAARDAPQRDESAPPPPAPAPAPARTAWTRDELIHEATRRILLDLASTLARDIKTRTVTPLVTQFLRPDGAGGRWLAEHKAAEPVVRRVQPAGALPSFKRLDAVPARAPTQGKPARRAAPAEAPAPERAWDPVALGLVQDAEEMYYLRELLAREARGEAGVPAVSVPVHEAGSARAQGFYRIPAADKAAHLADRNRATESAAPAAQALASARNNRADSRRLALDLEQHKRETLTDTDILHINQLQTRKKQLRFAKSPIHDWGLYAMERIPPGEMVIEYVGEVVRQQVADHREKMYERAVRSAHSRQGNFSTYLFRVDDDVVVDATNKGNIARLMNVRPPTNAALLHTELHGQDPHGAGRETHRAVVRRPTHTVPKSRSSRARSSRTTTSSRQATTTPTRSRACAARLRAAASYSERWNTSEARAMSTGAYGCAAYASHWGSGGYPARLAATSISAHACAGSGGVHARCAYVG